MYMSVVHHGGRDRCHLNGDHQHLLPLVAPVVLEDPRLQLVEVGQGGSRPCFQLLKEMDLEQI